MHPFKEKYEDYTIDFEKKLNQLYNDTRYPIEELFSKGKSEKTILKELKLLSIGFKGLYVFWEKEKAVYVGISKNVIRRLVQHIKGTTYHSSTFPIKILKMDDENKYGKLGRKEFKSHILKPVQKNKIKKMKISFIPFDDDVELYLFEVYCAIELGCRYNTFETH
jgi:predicted GIY-YIG superfamily endonuclease